MADNPQDETLYRKITMPDGEVQYERVLVDENGRRISQQQMETEAELMFLLMPWLK